MNAILIYLLLGVAVAGRECWNVSNQWRLHLWPDRIFLAISMTLIILFWPLVIDLVFRGTRGRS